MPEKEIEKDLYNSVGRWLHEAAWSAGLPINPSIGLDSFFKALTQGELEVNLNSGSKVANIGVYWKGEVYSASISYDQIVRGWDNRPPSSPISFYDSIYLVLDKIADGIPFELKGRHPEPGNWDDFRHTYPRILREKMEANWLPYFQKHHEHMLLPISVGVPDNVPELSKPEIFHEVIREYPTHLHAQVEAWNLETECSGGPCAEHLDEFNFTTDFNVDYHPSESTLCEYFWAIYLEKLARKKGYSINGVNMNASTRSRRQQLIGQGNSGLSGTIQWRDLKRANELCER